MAFLEKIFHWAGIYGKMLDPVTIHVQELQIMVFKLEI